MSTLQIVAWWSALSLYVINLGVGLLAQLRWVKLGLTHHILYFFVFSTMIATTILSFHPLLLLTLSALAYMPVSQPGTWKHPTAALVGLSGFLLATI